MPKVFASYYIVYRHCGSGHHGTGVSRRPSEEPLSGLVFIVTDPASDPGDHLLCDGERGSGSAKPLICIYAAPASLCVAGYVQSVTPKSLNFLMALFVLATVLYLFALGEKQVGYLKCRST